MDKMEISTDWRILASLRPPSSSEFEGGVVDVD
jgi:hypothetical protein